jgi:hypothetical protein
MHVRSIVNALSTLTLLGLGACALATENPPAEAESTPAADEALTASTGTVMTVTRDTRTCKAPLCGGYYVQAVNSTAAAQYVSGLDFSQSGLDANGQAALLAQPLTSIMLTGKMGAVDKASNTHKLVVLAGYERATNPQCTGSDRWCAPTAPPGWQYTALYSGPAAAAAPSCSGAQIFAGNSGLVAPTPTCGACGTSNGNTVIPATWETRADGCAVAAAVGACGAGTTCLAKPSAPFVQSMCIAQLGSSPCPPGFTQPFTYYEGVQDFRGCSSTCGGQPMGSAQELTPVTVCCAN